MRFSVVLGLVLLPWQWSCQRAAPGAPRSDVARDEAAAAGAPGAARDSQAAVYARAVESFEGEPRDDAWAAKVGPLVEEALARSLPAGTTRSVVECRTTKCSFEIAGGSELEPSEARRAMRSVQGQLARQGQSARVAFVSVSDAGGVRGRCFLTFEGR